MLSFLKICLLLSIVPFVQPCFSETDTTCYRIESSRVKIAYNSSFLYPGVRFGIESPVKIAYFTRNTKAGGTKSIVRSQFATADLSWYHHPGFHDNFYLTMGWTFRRSGSKGFYWDFSPEAGISRTLLGGTTYQVDDSGRVTIRKLAGYSYALISLGGGIGYDFSVVKKKPYQIFYKFNLLNMFPYNSTIYVRPAMELGLSYQLPGFLNMHTKIKQFTR